MPQDPAQTVLAPLQVDSATKADAWEAFNSSKNETDLQVKLMGMKGLPDTVKADLWEAKKGSAPQAWQPPNPAMQAKGQLQTSALQKMNFSPERAYNPALAASGLPSMPANVSPVEGQKIREQTGTAMATGALAGSAVAAPAATALGVAGGAVGGVAGRAGIEGLVGGLGADPYQKEIAGNFGELGGSLLGGGAGIKGAGMLPSAEKAAVRMNTIVSASKDVKVPVFDATAEAVRAKEMFHAGAPSLPAPMRRFLTRVMNPDNPPINLEEARDFYQASTKQTAKVWSEMSKPMQRQMALFTKALGENIESALNNAKPGEGTALRGAMDEYHSALTMKSGAVKAAKWGAGVGATALGVGAIDKWVRSLGAK